MKKKVHVLQFPAEMSRDSYFMTADQVKAALEKYEVTAIFYGEGDDDELCEMAFDISNNPARTAQRAWFFGNNRSLSVGDVVKVNGRPYLCASVGWVAL